MNAKRAVLESAKRMLDLHGNDIISSEHAILSIVPGSGHGHDIWLRSKSIHCVAEVTVSGWNHRWTAVNPSTKRKIIRRLNQLHDYIPATQRYLFVGNESIAEALRRRPESNNVSILCCAQDEENQG